MCLNKCFPNDIDVCRLQTQEYAKEQCVNVGLNSVFGECTEAILWTRFHDICQEEVCAFKASKESSIPVCTMISALAHECAANGFVIDWMKDGKLAELCTSSSESKLPMPYLHCNKIQCNIVRCCTVRTLLTKRT